MDSHVPFPSLPSPTHTTAGFCVRKAITFSSTRPYPICAHQVQYFTCWLGDPCSLFHKGHLCRPRHLPGTVFLFMASIENMNHPHQHHASPSITSPYNTGKGSGRVLGPSNSLRVTSVRLFTFHCEWVQANHRKKHSHTTCQGCVWQDVLSRWIRIAATPPLQGGLLIRFHLLNLLNNVGILFGRVTYRKVKRPHHQLWATLGQGWVRWDIAQLKGAQLIVSS